jgi:hypothetical protein
MKLQTLIAYVGAFNVLIHMKDTCYALHVEETFGPAKNARELARTGRTIAQEAIVKALACADTGEAEQTLSAAYLALCGVITALKAMDPDGSQRIGVILDAVQ